MNKHEKEVVKAQLMSEKQTLKTIQAVYKKALEDIENKLKISDGKIEVLLKDIDSLTEEQRSILQSQIYQRKFQRSLKSQLEIMLKDLAVNQYGTVSDYLKASYHNGYIGALYNINMQGMPLIMPIDPYLVHRAIEIDSKIKHGLYQNLVDKVEVFKHRIANDISRGIASSTSYHDMATWIRHGTKVSVGQSMRIVRTEGNRIYNAAALDCGKGAKERGCDLVKVWDSTLDMKTRPTHRECDGQVRELDEGFKNSNGEAKAPGQFGIASEDINCRCAVLIKPRWDVDGKFTKRDNQSGELKEFEGVKEYEEFKEKYWKNIGKTEGKTQNSVDKSGESGIIKNIEISDIQTAAKGSTISKEVVQAVYDTLKKSNSQFVFDDVAVVKVDPVIIMQTDPVKKGTFFDIRLNLNENSLGGKTVEEINNKLKGTDLTVANTLEEAITHELYHAKLISGLNQAELEALYDELSDIHIKGISPTAWKDGSECIAETGVLFERGETEKIPEDAKNLFNKYIGGIL